MNNITYFSIHFRFRDWTWLGVETFRPFSNFGTILCVTFPPNMVLIFYIPLRTLCHWKEVKDIQQNSSIVFWYSEITGAACTTCIYIIKLLLGHPIVVRKKAYAQLTLGTTRTSSSNKLKVMLIWERKWTVYKNAWVSNFPSVSWWEQVTFSWDDMRSALY